MATLTQMDRGMEVRESHWYAFFSFDFTTAILSLSAHP